MTDKKHGRNKVSCNSYKGSNVETENRKHKIIQALKHSNAALDGSEFQHFTKEFGDKVEPLTVISGKSHKTQHLKGYAISALVGVWRNENLSKDIKEVAIMQVLEIMKLQKQQVVSPSVQNQSKINGLWKSVVLYFMPGEGKVDYTPKVKPINNYGHIAPWWASNEKPQAKEKSTTLKKVVKAA